jgi:hypothetical protein
MLKAVVNKTLWQKFKIQERVRDKTGMAGWVHIMEVFEWQAEEIVFYSESNEEILKVKKGK